MHNQYSLSRLSLVLFGVICLACSNSPSPKAGTLVVQDAWVRATPDTGATTAAYMRLVNGSSGVITVSHFESDAARTIELHESMMDNHMMMHMTPKPNLPVSPDSSAVLQPNGLHLMLIGTTRPLTVGEHVRIRLRLSSGATVETTADVRAP